MDNGLFRALGGTATCRKLSAAFYARVERDPLLRPLFPGKTFTCAIEEFAAFLVQFLGGPSEDSQRRWWLSLRESHLRFKIGPDQRDAWMGSMVKALDDVQIEEPARGALLGFFERSSAYVVNRGQAPAVAGDGGLSTEIAQRWNLQRDLDQAVAAVRSGNADRAIALAEDPTLRTWNPSGFAGLLALMVRSGHAAMRDYVHQKLTQDPALVQQRLLHVASAAGSLATVELLLRLGADPKATDGGGHTPLYWLANECQAPGGADVVRALVRAGAQVDACDGVKHCTALHMAARRGNVEIAEALLDCGADREARDSLGETPLRRAVNCSKIAVASLLLARGADPYSRGSKGLTPVLAARTNAMKQLLTARSPSSPLA